MFYLKNYKTPEEASGDTVFFPFVGSTSYGNNKAIFQTKIGNFASGPIEVDASGNTRSDGSYVLLTFTTGAQRRDYFEDNKIPDNQYKSNANCPAYISKIEFGNEIKEIGQYAFYNCDSLSTVVLNNVEIIDAYAFQDCNCLATVTGNKLKTVGYAAFHQCTSLSSICLNNVTSLGGHAFYRVANSSSLSISIPKVTVLNGNTFTQAKGLVDIHMPKVTKFGGEDLGETKITKLILPEIKTITQGLGSFSQCTGLTTVYMPELESIQGEATARMFFNGCSALKNVYAPKLKTIYCNYAFASCTSLTFLNLPSVTYVGNWVFQGCTSLKEINVPNLCDFATSPFQNCTSLQYVYMTNRTVAQVKKSASNYYSKKVFAGVPSTCQINCKDGTLTVSIFQ